MSKRNKKMSSKRSAFKLEALEQRQLLATIVGGTGGTEVGSNITVGGKVYDQILMTGSSISVQADPGQIVRVDFMDPTGDILHTEFSGSGTMNISLANFVAAAVPTKYATTTQYVTGLASFTITNSDATSNFLVTSIGPVTAFNGIANPIFANGTLTGGDNIANVSRLVIVGDANNLVAGAGTAFGSIFAGNAVFGDTSGVTGIYAPNTSFKTGSTITIGDIVAAGSSTPVLALGLFSDVKTVTVAGGSLPKTASGYTGPGYGNANFTSNVLTVVSATGTNSKGTVLPTLTIVNNNTATVNYTSGLGAITIDGSTATTASLDALYKGSYLQDVTINNGLAAGVTFHALQFGNVTVNGNLAGIITTDANDDNASNTNEQGIGNVTITGNIVDGGYIESSTSIGNITVGGTTTHTLVAPAVTISGVPTANASAVFSTIGRSGLSAAIGSVTFTGDVNLTSVEGLINANITGASGTSGTGTISGANFTVNNGAALVPVIQSGGTGNSIGALTFTGDVSVTDTAQGFIKSGLGVGNFSGKSLTLNVAAGTGILSGASSKASIGNITTTGGNLTLTSGIISAPGATGGGSVGNIAVSNTGNLVLGSGGISAANGNVGSITIDSGNLTTTAPISAGAGNVGAITLKAGNLSIDGNITAAGGNVGAISVTNTTATAVIGVASNVAISAQVNPTTTLGGGVGAITVTSTAAGVTGNLTLGTGAKTGQVFGVSVGNIAVNAGNLVFTNAGSRISAQLVASTGVNPTQTTTTAVADAWLGTSIGNVTVTGGGISGTSGTIAFQANKIGNVSVTGGSGTAVLLSDVIFSAKGTTQAAALTSSIGNITLDDTAAAASAISKSAAAVASTTNVTGTGFSSTGNIGNIVVNANLTGKILNDVTTASLVFRAGSSEMLAASNTLANGVSVKTASTSTTINSVSIGNVTINGNLSTGLSGAAAGSGLVVDAGADVVAAGYVATVTQNAAASISVGATTGTSLATGAITSGSIGNVVLVDSSGSTNRSGFNTSNITENNVGAHAAGVSTIIADNIASIVVNGGVQLLNVTPTGVALKGVLNTTTSATLTTGGVQSFSSNTSDLVVVVL